MAGDPYYFGKVLRVDLSRETAEPLEVPSEYYEQYFGGVGLGVRLLWEHSAPGVDPLSPSAVVGVFPGLFTGTVAPMSGRWMTVGKSPLTGGWGDANAGGYFGAAVKRSGFDGVLITGAAQRPTYLFCDGEVAELMDASDLWGKDATETEKSLVERHGKGFQVASIGQAAEKLSLITGLVNDRGRIAARSGLGAVFGSKKLKALAFGGKVKLPVHDPAGLTKIAREFNAYATKKPSFVSRVTSKMAPRMGKLLRWLKMPMKSPGSIMLNIYKVYGTTVANALSVEVGDSPVKNWEGIGPFNFPQSMARDISGPRMLQYKVRSYGCFSCPVRCGAILSVPHLGLEETHRPEYETACMFGTLSLNHDLDSIFEINETCNRAGLDSIHAGAAVAFAIECFENGVLTTEDTGGLELRWGDADAIKKLLRMIVDREGLGDLLADGVAKAADRIGNGAERFAMHAGGEALPAHDPKYTRSLALTYAVDPTPGRHTAASTDFAEIGPIEKSVEGFVLPKDRHKTVEGMAASQKMVIGLRYSTDSMGFCMFAGLFGKTPLIECFKAISGRDLTLDEVLTAGVRIYTLRLAFSLREGVNPLKVDLPGRATGNPPQERGPNKGVSLDLDAMKRAFYEVMGYDPETGVPLDETLEELDLSFVKGHL
ncbi:MAG: aldehyde ferredoxin oxidoreductase family protein [Promethearchaeota archaeon]